MSLLARLLIALSVLISGMTYAQTTHGQCPINGNSFCHKIPFCVGTNTGNLNYWTASRPFVDLMRSAAVVISHQGLEPQTLYRYQGPVDQDKYPTAKKASIRVLFYSNTSSTSGLDQLRHHDYSLLWDGETQGSIQFSNAQVLSRHSNEIRFRFNPATKSNVFFSYINSAHGPHVHNIRIVPTVFAARYRNWSWSNYRIGASTNPLIFNPGWLTKMKRGCIIRYMTARATNDVDAIRHQRDREATRTRPSFSSWYPGFAHKQTDHGNAVQHIWPRELIVEASLQTGSIPWINFRAFTYDALVGQDKRHNTADDDPLVKNIALMFRKHWGGPIYVEYGNEIWNFAHPFGVASSHVAQNGPGTSLPENYAKRSNLIQRVFAKHYDNDGCLAQGVVGVQTRNPGLGFEVLKHIDRRYVDVVAVTDYIGTDMWLNATDVRWNYIRELYRSVQSGQLSHEQAFWTLRGELKTNRSGLMTNKNNQYQWLNAVRDDIETYRVKAKQNGLCVSTYEGGLHMPLHGDIAAASDIDKEVASFYRQYMNSGQHLHLEMEIKNWLGSQTRRFDPVGPSAVFGSFIDYGLGVFSYWDNIHQRYFEEPKRSRLIGRYNRKWRPPLKLLR